MTNMSKVLLVTVFAGAATIASTKVAKADECLEVGWRDRSGSWVFYPARIDGEREGRMHINYEYKHGEMELKVFEKEKPDGEDVIVLRGRWFEGRDGRSGKVRLELKKGHHHARGWYTYGDAEDAEHFDFQLRDCERRGH